MGGAHVQLIQGDGADGCTVHGEGVAGVAREVRKGVRCRRSRRARVRLRPVLLTAVVLERRREGQGDGGEHKGANKLSLFYPMTSSSPVVLPFNLTPFYRNNVFTSAVSIHTYTFVRAVLAALMLSVKPVFVPGVDSNRELLRCTAESLRREFLRL